MTEDKISQVDFECALIIAEKKSNGKAPFHADAIEVASHAAIPLHDVVDAMRELARAGKYTPSITVNKVPVLRIKEK